MRTTVTRPVPLLLLLALALLPACSAPGARQATEQPARAVGAVTVEMTELASTFEAGGVLRARNAAVISSRILAPVRRVPVRAGDVVRRGQTLVEMDAAESTAQAARAAAALAAARQAGAVAAADVAGAESALTLARTTHGRISTLAAQKSATPQELDQAAADLGLAEARLAAARARVIEAEAALDAAAAAAEAARISASYAVLVAPFDGVVTERRVDPGTTAAPGTALVFVEEAGPVQLEVRLDAARAAHVRPRQAVDIRLDGDPDGTWRTARVAEISRIDPDAHSFAVKIDLENLPAAGRVPARLPETTMTPRSGMFGRARFEGPARAVLSIPETSVIRRGQLSFVFVIADSIVRLRAVSTGSPAGDRLEILDGLAAGERVVAAPDPALTDGARVTSGAGGQP